MEKNLVIEAAAIPVEIEFTDIEAMEETFAAGNCAGCSSISN